ncbi:acetyltransferase [Xanthomarina gelatinilytica]|uniref:acetyltransferase n=1 Tax=Xanthomarina gelatinilytica TaxID=1137281 RepID=UPI003AA9562D
MKDIVIIGAGGFGREIKVLIDDINKIRPTFNFLGFYDDGIEQGTLINGFKVLGDIAAVNAVSSSIQVVIAIGAPNIKRKVIEQLENSNIEYPVLIHPSVICSDDFVSIGKGSIICAGNILTCNIEIQDFVILNLMCTVGHDTIIKKYASFMPSVNISGEVIIHEGVYVGTGAKIINQLEIGENTIVGAGAVVSKSLPPNCTAVGIPAKIIKQD